MFKKYKVGDIIFLYNMYDIQKYFTISEVEIFEIIGYDKSGYKVIMYKSYEKYDEEKPTIMYMYETLKDRKDMKNCLLAKKIKKSEIFYFLFNDELV